MDLIVRDHDGSIIDPFERNIIEYFEYHWEKSQKLRSIFRNSNDSNSSIRQESSLLYTVLKQSENDDDRFNYNNCYNFCITLSNFICMIKQDMIINMAIYDAGNHKFITENYIVKWEKTGFVREVEKINNIRVVFTVCDLCAMIIDFYFIVIDSKFFFFVRILVPMIYFIAIAIVNNYI